MAKGSKHKALCCPLGRVVSTDAFEVFHFLVTNPNCFSVRQYLNGSHVLKDLMITNHWPMNARLLVSTPS